MAEELAQAEEVGIGEAVFGPKKATAEELGEAVNTADLTVAEDVKNALNINVGAAVAILAEMYGEVEADQGLTANLDSPVVIRDVLMLCTLDELRRIREALEDAAAGITSLTEGGIGGALSAMGGGK
jgi:hypothetical protein